MHRAPPPLTPRVLLSAARPCPPYTTSSAPRSLPLCPTPFYPLPLCSVLARARTPWWPWPPLLSSASSTPPRLSPSSCSTDCITVIVVPCRARRILFPAGTVTGGRCRRSAAVAIACFRGCDATGLLGPSQGHQRGRGGSLVLVPSLVAAAGDPPRRSREDRPSPLPASRGRRRRPPRCSPLSVSPWADDRRARVGNGSHMAVYEVAVLGWETGCA